MNKNEKNYLIKILSNNSSHQSNHLNSKISEAMYKFIRDSRIEHIFLGGLNNKIIKQNKKIIQKIKLNGDMRHIKTLEIIRNSLPFFKELNKEGIEFVVLKGFFLTNHVYRSKSLRPINDLDIYINPKDLDRYQNFINQSLVFNKRKFSFRENYSDFHLEPRYCKNYITRMEAHKKIFKKQNKNCVEEIFKSKQFFKINEFEIPILSPEYNFMHVVSHGTSQGNFDVGIQYLIDLKEIVNKMPLNVKVIKKISRKLKMDKELALTEILLEQILSTKLNLKLNPPEKEIVIGAKKIIFNLFFKETIAKLFYSNNSKNKQIKKSTQTISFFRFVKNLVFIAYRFFKPSNILQVLKLIFQKETRNTLNSKIMIDNYFNNETIS